MEKTKVIHRIELDEQWFWLVLWLGVATALCVIVASICYCDITIAKAAMAAGYEQAILPGSQSSHWVKIK